MRNLAALTLAATLCPGFALSAAGPTVGGFWAKRVPLIEQKLIAAAAQYSQKDIKAAKKNCDDAYFALFEAHDANMEIAIRQHLSVALAADLETRFGEIRKSFAQNKESPLIKTAIDKLKKDLLAAATDLDKNKVPAQ